MRSCDMPEGTIRHDLRERTCTLSEQPLCYLAVREGTRRAESWLSHGSGAADPTGRGHPHCMPRQNTRRSPASGGSRRVSSATDGNSASSNSAISGASPSCALLRRKGADLSRGVRRSHSRCCRNRRRRRGRCSGTWRPIRRWHGVVQASRVRRSRRLARVRSADRRSSAAVWLCQPVDRRPDDLAGEKMVRTSRRYSGAR